MNRIPPLRDIDALAFTAVNRPRKSDAIGESLRHAFRPAERDDAILDLLARLGHIA